MSGTDPDAPEETEPANDGPNPNPSGAAEPTSDDLGKSGGDEGENA